MSKPAFQYQELLDEVMFSVVLKILEDIDPKMYEQIVSADGDPQQRFTST